MGRKFKIRLSHEQRELRRAYGGLFEDVAELLLRFDPAHLNFGTNVDEYDGEVERILPRLQACRSPEDVELVLRAVFSEALIGRVPRLTGVSAALWNLWTRVRSEGETAPRAAGATGVTAAAG